MRILPVLLIICCSAVTSCSRSSERVDVKRDFEYYYSVYEKSFLIVVDGIRKKQVDRSLDDVERYLKQEEKEIENVGRRLNSIILTEEESMHLIKFTENYERLNAKYNSYIDENLNSEQKDRFVDLVVLGIGKKMMDQLMMPKSSTDFFKKAIR